MAMKVKVNPSEVEYSPEGHTQARISQSRGQNPIAGLRLHWDNQFSYCGCRFQQKDFLLPHTKAHRAVFCRLF